MIVNVNLVCVTIIIIIIIIIIIHYCSIASIFIKILFYNCKTPEDQGVTLKRFLKIQFFKKNTDQGP